MSNERALVLSEACRFYTKDGRPFYEIEKKDGGLRPTTITDARKIGAVPSVSEVIKGKAQPELDLWKAENIIRSSMANPKSADEADESYIKRIYEESQKYTKLSAERGKEIHAAMAEYTTHHTVPIDAISANACVKLEEFFIKAQELYGEVQERKAHFSFVNTQTGYGGEMDHMSITKEHVILVDFKSVDLKKFKKPYYKWALQLAAYSKGVPYKDKKIHCYQMMIDRNEPNVLFYSWDDDKAYTMEDLYTAFTCLLGEWRICNKYPYVP